MSLLAVDDIHTYYGEAHILQGVSLTVGEGEVVTMIGRNGAGKTTTLLSIMGIARARRGAVRLGGDDITRFETHDIVRRGIGWVPEERRVLPNLTVLENLRLGMMAADRAGSEQRLEEALEFFPRLRERLAQKGRFLSGGEQQMLAIARGLVARPRIMLVDEPTEGLAPLLVQSLTHILRRAASSSRARRTHCGRTPRSSSASSSSNPSSPARSSCPSPGTSPLRPPGASPP
jgi:branched-chain amino acid transport system ATP-binding protein